MSDFELSFLLSIASLMFAISLSYAIYLFRIYKERKLTYKLFAARDSLIRCVAVGAISDKDILFQLFYSNINNIINSVHSDFFSLKNFIKFIHKFESSEELKKGNTYLTNELKKRSPQFQAAVMAMILASQEIMIEKNIILKLFRNFFMSAYFVKSTFFNVFKKINAILKIRAYYSEYEKLEKLRINISNI